MKTNYTILFFLLFPLFLDAQISKLDVNLAHNWMHHRGRDIELSADVFFNKNIVHFGINYFQNDAIADTPKNGSRIFRALTFNEKWGITTAYKRLIQLSDSNLELYPKLEIQMMKLSEITAASELEPYSYPPIITTYPAIFSLNNTIGLDAKAKLYKQLYLTGGIEGGVLLINRDIRTSANPSFWYWEMIGNFSIGLTYRFFE